MKHFKMYSREDLTELTTLRRFESRIGERIRILANTYDWAESMKNDPAPFVLLGIPEDMGVKANYGKGGADTTWLPFLTHFLNTQSNDFFTGEEVLLLGYFDFGDIQFLIESNAYNQEEGIDAYRHAVKMIDDAVEDIVKVIATAGKIPIVVGGGQNNAYPIIKAVAKGHFKLGKIPSAKINCVNLDAHPDYSITEGRHHANAFHYAVQDGFLDKYQVLAVHENALSQSVLMDFNKNPNLQYQTYESIFLTESISFGQALEDAVTFANERPIGVEVDMDVIEQVLSNHRSPLGISSLQARQYVRHMAIHAPVAYLHLSEAAVQMADGKKDEHAAALISYLVADFVKGFAAGKNQI